MTEFKVWAFGCPHEVKDVPLGWRPVHNAIQDATSWGWDVALDLGDHDASQGLPDDAGGQVVADEFASLSPEQRAAVYSLCGNHDRSGPWEPEAWWFRKWLDPVGENTAFSGVDTALRPYATDGTWERYKFQVGNLVFLMLSDVNRPVTPGRGVYGGDPGGVISEETFEWWRQQVEAHSGDIVITCHHYLPRETTIATGDYEGVQWDSANKRWEPWIHGCGRNAKHSSRLSYIGETDGAPHFETYLAAHPGAVAIWLGAHSHLRPGQRINGRSFVEEKWGCTFVNAAALTQHHGANGELYPRSRLLTFEDGSDEVEMKLYLHTSTDFSAKGWWPNARYITLPRPSQL